MNKVLNLKGGLIGVMVIMSAMLITAILVTPTRIAAQEEPATVVDIATGSDDFTTLVDALVQESLVETLSGEGPFTVFAPDNDAFAAALEELDVTAEELLAREDLSEILTYHVVAGKVLSGDITDGMTATTVNGEELTLKLNEGAVSVMDANGRVIDLKTADLEAGNGVVHVLRNVLLPMQSEASDTTSDEVMTEESTTVPTEVMTDGKAPTELATTGSTETILSIVTGYTLIGLAVGSTLATSKAKK